MRPTDANRASGHIRRDRYGDWPGSHPAGCTSSDRRASGHRNTPGGLDVQPRADSADAAYPLREWCRGQNRVPRLRILKCREQAHGLSDDRAVVRSTKQTVAEEIRCHRLHGTIAAGLLAYALSNTYCPAIRMTRPTRHLPSCVARTSAVNGAVQYFLAAKCSSTVIGLWWLTAVVGFEPR